MSTTHNHDSTKINIVQSKRSEAVKFLTQRWTRSIHRIEYDTNTETVIVSLKRKKPHLGIKFGSNQSITLQSGSIKRKKYSQTKKEEETKEVPTMNNDVNIILNDIGFTPNVTRDILSSCKNMYGDGFDSDELRNFLCIWLQNKCSMDQSDTTFLNDPMRLMYNKNMLDGDFSNIFEYLIAIAHKIPCREAPINLDGVSFECDKWNQYRSHGMTYPMFWMHSKDCTRLTDFPNLPITSTQSGFSYDCTYSCAVSLNVVQLY